MDGLTDESLKQQVYPEGRTLGRIAWHLTTNIPDYLTHFGLNIDGVKNAENVPTSAKEIAETFKEVSSHRQPKSLKNNGQTNPLNKYKKHLEEQESNAQILMGLIKHIVHHRGQITVLMRQAGLKPFGVYGPPKEDWIHLGVENPPQ